MSVKNKRILKVIARRFAKSILIDSSDFAFMETGLSSEEEYFISDELEKIANRITELPTAETAKQLVDEYYE